jgi:hypothetical protein
MYFHALFTLNWVNFESSYGMKLATKGRIYLQNSQWPKLSNTQERLSRQVKKYLINYSACAESDKSVR